MSSWQEETRERDWLGFILLALALPMAFVAAYFILTALLAEIARWFV